MDELEKVKLLAAAHKLILSEVSKLRNELLEEIAYPLLPEQDQVVIEGPQGRTGRDGVSGLKGDRGDDGSYITETRIEDGSLVISLSNGSVYDLGNIIGEQGIPGETGQDGLVGEQGIQGIPGPQGDKGDRGDNGEPGVDGHDGRNGVDGIDGRAGIDGIDGKQGPQGIPGVKGPRGDRGEAGRQGISGPKGERGDKGDPGPKGDNGEKGDNGQDGIVPDIAPLEKKLLKDLKDYKKQISDQVTKSIKYNGGSSGGGEVRLLRLDDVDTGSLANNAFIKYNASTGKLIFTTVAPGSGATSFSGLTGTILSSQVPQSSINISKFVNDRSYANTSQLTSYISVANADLKFATKSYAASNTYVNGQLSKYLEVANSSSISVSQYLEVANATLLLAAKASTTYVNSQLALKVTSIAAGNNITLGGNSTVVTINSTGAAATASDSIKLRFSNSTGQIHKLVVLNSSANTIPASCKTLTHANRVLGILNGSGDTVTSGLITHAGWAWTPEQVLYLGDNGDIITTSTIDGSIFTLPVGYAISATRVFVRLGTPVILGP